MKGKRIALLDLLLFGLFGVMLLAVFEPGGPLGRRIGDWREQRRVSSLLHDEWDDIAGSASWIRSGAPASRIVEFSDYECPYCRRMHERLSLLSQDGVEIGYLHLPLSIHPHAETAALAAICAEYQDRFPQMHDYLMTESEWMDGLPWEEVATAAGIPSGSEFVECLGGGAAARRLATDMETARRLDVRSTPTFVTEKEVRSGAQTVDELQTMLSR